jgi:hypothetical protein
MQDNAITKKDVVGKAVHNKTKRKTKNEMAGRCVHGPEKDRCKRMERQSKGSRDLEAYRRGGQGPPRVVAPFKKKPGKNAMDISSYQPISLLPTISRVLEKFILKKINKDLNPQDWIPDHQFGF